MTRRGGNGHQRLVEACTTIARAVSKTEAGFAHTVQLMLSDPTFRADSMQQATLQTIDAAYGYGRSTATLERRKHVREAVDVLRSHVGRIL